MLSRFYQAVGLGEVDFERHSLPFALSGGWYLDSSKVALDSGGLRLLKVQQVTFLTQVADHRHMVVPLLATGHQLLCS